MIAPISIIRMSTHKASPMRWLLKPPSHIWATCHPVIAREPFKKACKHALHYHDYQLPDHSANAKRLLRSLRIMTHTFSCPLIPLLLSGHACSHPCTGLHHCCHLHSHVPLQLTILKKIIGFQKY